MILNGPIGRTKSVDIFFADRWHGRLGKDASQQARVQSEDQNNKHDGEYTTYKQQNSVHQRLLCGELFKGDKNEKYLFIILWGANFGLGC